MKIGDIFDTWYEKGCVVMSLPDDDGNFNALDSDGVYCVFHVSMIAPPA